MICVFPFHTGDVHRLLDQLRWIQQLGGCPNHKALLVADCATPFPRCVEANRRAKECFSEVRCISNGKTTQGWPAGPNSLFQAAATFIGFSWPEPWLLLETDAAPLKEGWLDQIEAAYAESKADYLGDVYQGLDSKSGLPTRAFSGIAVYPPDAHAKLSFDADKPWDMANRELFLDKGNPTLLIQHFYGEEKKPPTFSERRHALSGLNTVLLSEIRREAVLFHRCKDPSLIRLLRKQRGISCSDHPPVLVLPVCSKDAHLLELNLEWMRELDGHSPRRAILAYDRSLPAQYLARLTNAGRDAFKEWSGFVYPEPKTHSWPQAPNLAFQSAARYLQKENESWFWFEADAWPVRPGWFDTLSVEYQNCGKPVMGPVVKPLGHVNGVAFYPPDFPEIAPSAMRCTGVAWDYAWKEESKNKVHDASNLMQHAWGMGDNDFTAFDGVGSPTFSGTRALDWLLPTAVMFHRCKDFSLVQALRKSRS